MLATTGSGSEKGKDVPLRLASSASWACSRASLSCKDSQFRRVAGGKDSPFLVLSLDIPLHPMFDYTYTSQSVHSSRLGREM